MKRKIGILLLTVTAAAAMAAGLAACTSADGASAYDLAVANGYSGTEAEWLETLNGSDGTNGTNGTDGVGIDSVALNKYNDMVVTYTDETSETLKYHGTIANPYVIYSGIYEAAYSDTFGYVSFLEEDYITVDAGETVYITYILEDAANIYIGVDGGDEDEISLGYVVDYVIDDAEGDYTWATSGTVLYTSLACEGAATLAVTNSGDEEITLQTAVGEYTLTLAVDKTVGTTLTADSYYAVASFTAPASGWYEFTLTGDGKSNVYVTGDVYDDEDNYYYVELNTYASTGLSGLYTFTTYLPKGVTIDVYCVMFDYDTIDSSTFAITVAETTIDTSLAISSEGFTTEALEGSDDYYDSSKVYTYYVTETGYYKITASAATEDTAALVEVFDYNRYVGNELTPDSTATIDEEGSTIASLYWKGVPDASCYMFFTVGSFINITVYYDAIVTFEAIEESTLTSEGLTLTGLENLDEDDYSSTRYLIHVEEAGTYTFTYTDKTEDESDDGITVEIAYGDGNDSIYWGSETIYSGDGSTFTLTAGTYIVIYVYSDAELAITAVAATAE